uniref:Skp1-related protein n=1 Tax=Ascaris lumbricoides TaxID=6252 RepID=A0A0M3IEI5_ASCLU
MCSELQMFFFCSYAFAPFVYANYVLIIGLVMKEDDDSVINLLSSDGHLVSVPKCVAVVSQTIAQLFEGVPHDGHSPIPLYEVDYNSLKKIVAWMIRHSQSPTCDTETRSIELRHDGKADNIRDWERAQFECEERNDLFRLMNAASYLDIAPLTRATSAFVAEKLQTMTVDEARDYLNLVDDFTPEERERIRSETMWAEPMASSATIRNGEDKHYEQWCKTKEHGGLGFNSGSIRKAHLDENR